ncbi:MAG: hypothetical protein K2O39_02655, partial [Clostridiales bacterium]|nr:hypothetical protein [Clostridiales bacterium]
VYSATTQRIAGVNVTVVGDYQTGRKVTYNDVEYTLNGFGVAESESGNIKYACDAPLGVSRMLLYPDANNLKNFVIYIDYDGEYVAYDKGYTANNCSVPFFMMIFKNNTALLTLGSSTLEAFAFGHITWDDEDHTSGAYVRDDSVQFSDDYLTVNKMIKDFKFVVRTATVKDKNGKDNTSTFIYVYDVNATADEDNDIVIMNADGDELTLKPMAVTEIKDGQDKPVNVPSAAATFIKKGVDGKSDTEYKGTYRILGDKVTLTYNDELQTGSPSQTTTVTQTLTFKLEYNADGGITGFRIVAGNEGYWMSADDGRSYLYLSGETVGDNRSIYGGIYYEYDAESKTYTEYSGTYELTRDSSAMMDYTFGLGYDFTYETDELDEEGNNVKETFTFGLASDPSTGIMYFKKFALKISTQNVLYMSASIGRPALIGTLAGGGYTAHVLTLYPNTVYQSQYQGSLEWNEDWEVWVLTATNGSQFYFRILSGMGVFLLDNTYVAETKGMFTLSEEVV